MSKRMSRKQKGRLQKKKKGIFLFIILILQSAGRKLLMNEWTEELKFRFRPFIRRSILLDPRKAWSGMFIHLLKGTFHLCMGRQWEKKMSKQLLSKGSLIYLCDHQHSSSCSLVTSEQVKLYLRKEASHPIDTLLWFNTCLAGSFGANLCAAVWTCDSVPRPDAVACTSGQWPEAEKCTKGTMGMRQPGTDTASSNSSVFWLEVLYESNFLREEWLMGRVRCLIYRKCFMVAYAGEIITQITPSAVDG